jgi:hypothetical protein
LMVPSVRCNSYAISLLSLALQMSCTTCFSRRLSAGLRGFLISLGAAQLEQIRLPVSPRNSLPHRKQFRSCLNSIMLVTSLSPPIPFLIRPNSHFSVSMPRRQTAPSWGGLLALHLLSANISEPCTLGHDGPQFFAQIFPVSGSFRVHRRPATAIGMNTEKSLRVEARCTSATVR